jgi:hypothetical protein
MYSSAGTEAAPALDGHALTNAVESNAMITANPGTRTA